MEEQQPYEWPSTFGSQQAREDALEEEVKAQEAAQEAAQEKTQEKTQSAFDSAGDKRPIFAQSLGQFGSDFAKLAANAGIGLVTDVVDVGLGVADLVGQSYEGLTGQGDGEFNWGDVFNDSDNPWTIWRREAFKTETQAGQFMSNLTRLGLLFTSLPKAGAMGVAKVGGLLSKVDDASRLRKPAMAAVEMIEQSKKGQAALKAVQKGTAISTPGGKAAKIAANTPELAGTLNKVTQAAEVKGYTAKVTRRLADVGLSIRDRYRPRNLTQTLAYDALASFMVAGEGSTDLDETMSDMFRDMGLPYADGLTTSLEDTMLSIKMKQVVEGIPLSIALQSVIDLWTINRYARHIKNADSKTKQGLIEAFAVQSEGLGSSVAKIYSGDVSPFKGLDVESTIVPTGVGGPKYVSKEGVAVQSPFNPRTIPDDQPDPWTSGALVSQPGGTADLVNQRVPGGALAVDDTIEEVSVSGVGPRGMRPRLEGTPDRPLLDEPIQPVDVNVIPPDGAGQTVRTGQPAPTRNLIEEGVDAVPIQEIRKGLPKPAIVTPQTIKSAFETDMANAFKASMEMDLYEVAPNVFANSSSNIKRLMPKTRLDALDYFDEFGIQFNGAGVTSASDSVWSNFIVNRGMKEGWINIDQDFQFNYNRRLALDLDVGDEKMLAASKVDEAEDLASFDVDVDEVNPSDDIIDADFDELVKAAEEASTLKKGSVTAGLNDLIDKMVANDRGAARRAGEHLDRTQKIVDEMRGEEIADKLPAARDEAEMDQMLDDIGVRPLGDEEIAEANAALASAREMDDRLGVEAIAGSEEAIEMMDDIEIISKGLGLTDDDIDQLTAAYIERNPITGRTEVIDSDGAVLGEFKRQSQAEAFLEKRYTRMLKEMSGRARKEMSDAIDKPLNIEADPEIVETVGKGAKGVLKLTKAQKRVLGEYSEDLAKVLNENPKQTNYEFGYDEMAEFANGLEELVQSGEISKRDARVMQNVINKVREQKAMLDPIVQRQAEADDLAANAKRLIDHNDYCI